MATVAQISQRDAYRIIFKDYPDVLNIDEMSSILGISTKTGYQILKRRKNSESQSRSVIQDSEYTSYDLPRHWRKHIKCTKDNTKKSSL